jgi:hypothetical protein
MTISAVSSSSSSSVFQTGGTDDMSQMKKYFDNLGSALTSGNLDDAKKAFSQLQANAPSKGSDSNNPMSAEMDSLKSALDSGDLTAAQQAYSKIKEKMSQGPPAGGAPSGSATQSAQTDTVQVNSTGTNSNESTSSNSDTTVYDKRDANKDGVVSDQEAIAYELKHPGEAASSSNSLTTVSSQNTSNINTIA